jgi:hypothetical protein
VVVDSPNGSDSLKEERTQYYPGSDLILTLYHYHLHLSSMPTENLVVYNIYYMVYDILESPSLSKEVALLSHSIFSRIRRRAAYLYIKKKRGKKNPKDSPRKKDKTTYTHTTLHSWCSNGL